MQSEQPTYQTRQDRLNDPKPDEAEDKLGSAQPDSDPFDAVGGAGTAGAMPTEIVAAEQRPIEVRPAYAIPPETQPTDFMTPDARPVDQRPREFFPVEGR